MSSDPNQKIQSDNGQSDNRPDSAIAIWMPIGAGLGVALGLVFDTLNMRAYSPFLF